MRCARCCGTRSRISPRYPLLAGVQPSSVVLRPEQSPPGLLAPILQPPDWFPCRLALHRQRALAQAARFAEPAELGAIQHRQGEGRGAQRPPAIRRTLGTATAGRPTVTGGVPSMRQMAVSPTNSGWSSAAGSTASTSARRASAGAPGTRSSRRTGRPGGPGSCRDQPAFRRVPWRPTRYTRVWSITPCRPLVESDRRARTHRPPAGRDASTRARPAAVRGRGAIPPQPAGAGGGRGPPSPQGSARRGYPRNGAICRGLGTVRAMRSLMRRCS